MSNHTVGFQWRITEETFKTIEQDFVRLRAAGLRECTCGIRPTDFYHSSAAEEFREILKRTDMHLYTIWCGFGAPTWFDLVRGPETVGLVPPAYRENRLSILKNCARYAQSMGTDRIAIHFGFIPENVNDPNYASVVKTAQEAADICAEYGCTLLLEVGEETPTTLLRLLEDADRKNLAVDLDMANLILYGRGEPLGAIDVLGRYIKAVDAKDGLYPVSGRTLGEEVALGQGKVQLQSVVSRLIDIGYDGVWNIERDAPTVDRKISGILMGKTIMEGILLQEEMRRSELDIGEST